MSDALIHLTQAELSTLYVNFVSYRDNHCDGWAKEGITNFYLKHGLNEFVAKQDGKEQK